MPATGQRISLRVRSGDLASPPPMAPPRPRHRFLSLFFVEEKTEPLASPQFPPATFPTSYYGPYPRPYPVLAAPQANDVKPPVATKTAKKPCVLTAWFQKITSWQPWIRLHRLSSRRPGPVLLGLHLSCREEQVRRRHLRERTLASPQGDSAIPARPAVAGARRSVQLGPSRATSRRKGSSSNASRLRASTNRRRASSRCSATSTC